VEAILSMDPLHRPAKLAAPGQVSPRIKYVFGYQAA
jgi:hypothetical protein